MTVDLSRQASDERAREADIRAAAGKARAMSRSFKGISRLTRRDYARIFLKARGLL